MMRPNRARLAGRGHGRPWRYRRGGREASLPARRWRPRRVVRARVARDLPLGRSRSPRARSPAASPVACPRTSLARPRTSLARPRAPPPPARAPAAPPPAPSALARRPPPPSPRGTAGTATGGTPPVTTVRLPGRASSPTGTVTARAHGTFIRSIARVPTTVTEPDFAPPAIAARPSPAFRSLSRPSLGGPGGRLTDDFVRAPVCVPVRHFSVVRKTIKIRARRIDPFRPRPPSSSPLPKRVHEFFAPLRPRWSGSTARPGRGLRGPGGRVPSAEPYVHASLRGRLPARAGVQHGLVRGGHRTLAPGERSQPVPHLPLAPPQLRRSTGGLLERGPGGGGPRPPERADRRARARVQRTRRPASP